MASQQQRFIRQIYVVSTCLALLLGGVLVGVMWVFDGRQSPGPGWWSAAGIALTAYLIIALLVITFGVSWAVRNVLRPLSNTSIVADRVAQGDLTVSIASVGTRRGDELTYAVRSMLQELRTLVRAIRTSAEEAAAMAEQISSSTQQMSASTEEVSSTCNDLTDRATTQAGLVRGAAADAARILAIAETLADSAEDPLALVPARGDILERMKTRGIPAYVSPLPSLKRVLPWHPPLALGQLVVLLRRAKPAILHANGSRACLYAVLAGQLLGIPVLWHVRETLKDLWIYDRFLFALSRAIVCVSESVKAKRFNSLSVRWKEKIDVVHNGVDSSVFCRNLLARARVRRELGIDDDEILFGVVANYVPLK